MRDLLLHNDWALPLSAGIVLGLILGSERRLRYKAELKIAQAERDQLAAGAVIAPEGGKFPAIPPQSRRSHG